MPACQSRSLLALSLSLVAALASTSASGKRRAAVPGSAIGIELDGNGDLWVRRQAVVARIPIDLPYPDFFLDVSAKTTGTTTTVRAEANCLGVQTILFSRARLEALLESAAARTLMRAGRWPVALAGFARAYEIDPTLAEAATDLAGAQAHEGRIADAVATLVAAAAQDPIWVAWRLADDGELATVAGAPELAKLYQRPPGGWPARSSLDRAHIAMSRARGLFAWRRAQSNHMSGERRDDELWIADIATGAVSARLGYGHRDRSAPAIGQMLAALGFTEAVPVHHLHAAAGAHDEEGHGSAQREITLPDAGLTVALDRDTVRVWRGKRRVGMGRFRKPKGADDPAWIEPWAAGIPGAVLVGAGVTIGDGCGAWDYDEVLRVALPEPAR